MFRGTRKQPRGPVSWQPMPAWKPPVYPGEPIYLDTNGETASGENGQGPLVCGFGAASSLACYASGTAKQVWSSPPLQYSWPKPNTFAAWMGYDPRCSK
jgi:hypothetical protein